MRWVVFQARPLPDGARRDQSKDVVALPANENVLRERRGIGQAPGPRCGERAVFAELQEIEHQEISPFAPRHGSRPIGPVVAGQRGRSQPNHGIIREGIESDAAGHVECVEIGSAADRYRVLVGGAPLLRVLQQPQVAAIHQSHQGIGVHAAIAAALHALQEEILPLALEAVSETQFVYCAGLGHFGIPGRSAGAGNGPCAI